MAALAVPKLFWWCLVPDQLLPSLQLSASPKKALHLLSHHKPELCYQLPLFGVILDSDIECDLGHRGFWPHHSNKLRSISQIIPRRPALVCELYLGFGELRRRLPNPVEPTPTHTCSRLYILQNDPAIDCLPLSLRQLAVAVFSTTTF